MIHKFQVGLLPANKEPGIQTLQDLCCIHFHPVQCHASCSTFGPWGEFLSTEFTNFMESKGILHQLTAPNTPQQNGIAERANRTIDGAACAMLQSVGMANTFWGCAVATTIHVRNRAPSRTNNYVSPHETLFGHPPDLSSLHVFGCLAYQHITQPRHKFDPTSERLVFMGYEGSTKGYKLWNPRTHKFIVSTDVTFEETTFPLRTQSPHPPQPSSISLPSPEYVDLALPESDDEDAHQIPAIPTPAIPQPAVPPQQLPPAPPPPPPDAPLPNLEPPRQSI